MRRQNELYIVYGTYLFQFSDQGIRWYFLRTARTPISMLLCPEHIQTSPNKTSFNVAVTLFPLTYEEALMV